jgi:hypothetical protein
MLAGISLGKQQPGKLKGRWKNNIRMDHEKFCGGAVEVITFFRITRLSKGYKLLTFEGIYSLLLQNQKKYQVSSPQHITLVL